MDLETDRDGENGNTKHSPLKKPKQPLQLKTWFFTFNNYNGKTDISLLETRFKEICIKYVFQEEIGKCGTPHLQGNIWLKNKMRWSEFKLSSQIHWEKTRNETAAANYCQKSETSKEGSLPYIFGFPKPIMIIDENKLYPYQKEILDLFHTEPDRRSVHWYWEPVGKVGKSDFCKFMYVKYKVLVIQGGKFSDIMNIIFNTDMDTTRMIIIDIPRCNKNKISYAAIECILTGMITNTKYETGTKVFNAPHVVVFCNKEPELYDKEGEENFSMDRWKIVKINNKIVIDEEKPIIKNNYILEL